MSVYFFDNKQQLIKIKNSRTLLQCLQEKEITSDKSDLMKDILTVSCLHDADLEQCHFMAVRENKGTYSLYKILEEEIDSEIMNFKGVNFGAEELNNYVISDARPVKKTITDIVKQILTYTDGEWLMTGGVNRIGSANFYYTSVKEALKIVQQLGCELLFFCDIDGEGIRSKWVEVRERIGKESDNRFEVGSTAIKVVKTKDRTNIVTSLVGRGKGEDVGDGYGRRLQFDTVEWKKPVPKPKGQAFIEIKELTEQYGIPTKKGKMRKREQVVIFEDIEDKNELLNATYQTLLENSRPLIQFSSEVIGASSIGDIVSIHDYDKNYHYKTRVFAIKNDILNKKVESSLGDNLKGSSASNQLSKASSGISELKSMKMNFYDSTEISKWQSDIIRGAKGGSVLLMSPWDTNKGKSREPYQMVIMNKGSLKESNHFLVMNSEGIGFINGDFNKDKFETAWTIDGTFNAKFIRAGVLSGILIKGNIIKSSDEGDFQIVLDGGELTFEKKYDSEDIDDQHGHPMLTMKALYTDDKLNGISMVQIPNYSFGINSGGLMVSKPVIEIPKESTIDSRKLNLFGEVRVVGDFYVNGVKIDSNGGSGGSGGGSGGWNGQYPPEITSDVDKRAWSIWSTLRGHSYSKAASAAILGNIQGESGHQMNPDTEQVGGPAYGLVQWDGSAYPLVGQPTYNGREYVQRLMKAANITDDYRTIISQVNLIEWSMKNGQWIGAVEPKTVSGFKASTSPRTAARAFLYNFERPATGHPEREDYAQAWYDKFKDLKQPGGKYGMPVGPGYQITSWFGNRDNPTDPGNLETHKGMDFSDKVGSPIFAAESGEVIASLPTASSGGFGEYIVIKHADGNFTGYAHMTMRMASQGAKVSKGQQIGTMGSTGESTGSHLHFSVGDGLFGNYQDPAPYLGLKRP
ncbi:minor head protein [Brochothrix phage BtpYZU03]|nr:minor head protein [Brochothrix phage BtpYZU03]